MEKKRSPVKKVAAIEYDSDIEPEDFLTEYIKCKKIVYLSQLNKPTQHSQRPSGRNGILSQPRKEPVDSDTAKALRKIKKIENDVLFDPYPAHIEWEKERIQLERDAASRRHAEQLKAESVDSQESETLVDSDDEISKEAARIGEALLEETGSDDDAALADLFASLPVDEVDPVTGKSSTVVHGSDGSKVTIRDFGKWTGVNPTRILEEACRARYGAHVNVHSFLHMWLTIFKRFFFPFEFQTHLNHCLL
jgi:ATP-dependent RNA helicase DHX29